MKKQLFTTSLIFGLASVAWSTTEKSNEPAPETPPFVKAAKEFNEFGGKVSSLIQCNYVYEVDKVATQNAKSLIEQIDLVLSNTEYSKYLSDDNKNFLKGFRQKISENKDPRIIANYVESQKDAVGKVFHEVEEKIHAEDHAYRQQKFEEYQKKMAEQKKAEEAANANSVSAENATVTP